MRVCVCVCVCTCARLYDCYKNIWYIYIAASGFDIKFVLFI